MSTDTILIPLSIIWLGSEIALTRMMRSAASDTKSDAGSLTLIWLVIAAAVTAGVSIGHQKIGRIETLSSVAAVAGLVLIALGIAIRWIAIGTLRRHFTVDVVIRQGHELVQSGLYRFVRHPSYTGSLLSFFGLGISSSNGLSFLVLFLPVCSVFLYRIHIEEKALLAAFGEQYRAYAQKTSRLIPGLY